MPTLSTHFTAPWSLQSDTQSSRRRSTAPTSSSPDTASAAPGDAARGAQGGRAAQEGLRGHAGPVGAFAADELVLHEHHVEASGPRPIRDVLADGARAHDDHVHLALHVSPLRARSAPGSVVPA